MKRMENDCVRTLELKTVRTTQADKDLKHINTEKKGFGLGFSYAFILIRVRLEMINDARADDDDSTQSLRYVHVSGTHTQFQQSSPASTTIIITMFLFDNCY